jgi:hypothetical protein
LGWRYGSLPWTGVELFGLKESVFGCPLPASASIRLRRTSITTLQHRRYIILARPGNTFEKLKRDSNKKQKAEEKRESKRVRKATKLSGGPAKQADEPAE